MLYQKFRRLELGLLQKGVAKRSDIPRSILAQMETARVTTRPDELARIAKVLGCEVVRLRTNVSEASLGDGVEFRDAQREKAGA